jgi:addiction module HigA family antidote
MLPRKRTPTHPGEILSEEFLRPLGISQVALAEHLGVPVQRINELVRGKRGVTPATAWLLAGAFGTTPEFWLNLQSNHDLVRVQPTRKIRRLASAGWGASARGATGATIL